MYCCGYLNFSATSADQHLILSPLKVQLHDKKKRRRESCGWVFQMAPICRRGIPIVQKKKTSYIVSKKNTCETRDNKVNILLPIRADQSPPSHRIHVCVSRFLSNHVRAVPSTSDRGLTATSWTNLVILRVPSLPSALLLARCAQWKPLDSCPSIPSSPVHSSPLAPVAPLLPFANGPRHTVPFACSPWAVSAAPPSPPLPPFAALAARVGALDPRPPFVGLGSPLASFPLHV